MTLREFVSRHTKWFAKDERRFVDGVEYIRCGLGGEWARLNDEITMDNDMGDYEVNVKTYDYDNVLDIMTPILYKGIHAYCYFYTVEKSEYDAWKHKERKF